MRRLAVAVALSASSLVASPASADDEATRVRAAAEHFDAGVGAFKKKDFEGAASHFEAADAAVPSPKTLRQAIRARAEAGQGSRAATLAATALSRYPADDTTAKLARDTIEKFQPLLYKVTVSCAPPCSLAVGAQAVPGEAAARRVVYLDPGSATLKAIFSGEPSAQRDVEATAGGETEIRLEPRKKKEPPKVVEPPPPPPPPDDKAKKDPPPDDPKPEPPPERKGISPAFFAVSLAGTVGVGAATIWSGVDTQNNPGAAAVQAACQGKGPTCPLYQQDLAKEARTNALIGGTAGGAALTIILAIFTGWKSSPKPPPAGATAWLTVNEVAVTMGDPQRVPQTPPAFHGSAFYRSAFHGSAFDTGAAPTLGAPAGVASRNGSASVGVAGVF